MLQAKEGERICTDCGRVFVPMFQEFRVALKEDDDLCQSCAFSDPEQDGDPGEACGETRA